MTAQLNAIDRLKGQRPEWQPWLLLVEEGLRESMSHAWDDMVPEPPTRADLRSPWLAGAALTPHPAGVTRWQERLIDVASRHGTPRLRGLAALLDADTDALRLFKASVEHDAGAVAEVAVAAGVDSEALESLTSLLAMPFLQACRRRWETHAPAGWVEGYCPVCGSWPALAEVRGIERSRHYRCGRCGGDWHARALWCPFCGMNDHHQLGALVAEESGIRAVVDTCRRCLGYVKTFTRLQGCAADAVMIEDLSSIELDVAALAEGYRRPAGTGCPLGVTVEPRAARRAIAWRP